MIGKQNFQMKERYLRTVILVSIAIMIYQGIANSDLGIVSELTHQNGNSWAGPFSTSLLFAGSGLMSMYNRYIGKYSFGRCFFVGSLGFTLFIGMGLIFMKLGFSTTVMILIFVLSFIAGCLCSVFYNTQFNYINILSKIDNKEIKYFGINMGLAQSSNIFGNLFSSMLIKPLGQFTSVMIMEIVIFCTSLTFLFFPNPKHEQLKLIQGNKESQDRQSLPNSIIDQVSDEPINNVQNSMSPFRVSCCFSMTGIIISFIYCLLSIILYKTFEHKMSNVELNHLTFVIFIFEGVGEMLGGLLMIFTSHKIKDPAKVCMLTSSLFIISVITIYIGSIQENPYLIGFGVVLTGISDCSCFILTLTIAGLWKEKGISTFNISQSITVAVSAIIIAFAPLFVTFIWIGVFFIWNIIGLVLYRLQVNRNLKPQLNSNSIQ